MQRASKWVTVCVCENAHRLGKDKGHIKIVLKNKVLKEGVKLCKRKKLHKH